MVALDEAGRVVLRLQNYGSTKVSIYQRERATILCRLRLNRIMSQMVEVSSELLNFADSLQRKRHRNQRAEKTSIFFATLLASGITTIGILGDGWSWRGIKPHQWSGLVGVILTAVMTLNRALGFGEKAASLRLIEAEARNLSEDRTLSSDDRWRKFGELRLKVAQTRAGEGLDAVAKR